jgi:cyclohexyl-isocyanide hydratase
MKQTETPLQIGMLLYPGLTLLDLIGPATVFRWFSDIHLVWKTKDLVRSDNYFVALRPKTSFLMETGVSERTIGTGRVSP